MAKWAVVVSAEQFELERLYASASLTVPGSSFAPGDEALLIAASTDPVIFGLARADPSGTLRYTINLLDAALPAGRLPAAALGAHPLQEPEFRDAAARLSRDEPPKRTWLVSVDLPIEASTPAEAVRAFWAYVRDLGPAELPAFVWPAGNELAMQAFVLGAESNQDPEED